MWISWFGRSLCCCLLSIRWWYLSRILCQPFWKTDIQQFRNDWSTRTMGWFFSHCWRSSLRFMVDSAISHVFVCLWLFFCAAVSFNFQNYIVFWGKSPFWSFSFMPMDYSRSHTMIWSCWERLHGGVEIALPYEHHGCLHHIRLGK